MESKSPAKSVTVTGCLKAGDSPDSFTLSDLKWSDKAKTSSAAGAVGTSGSTTIPAAVASATTLNIIPSATINLIEHVGHTIEVTGPVNDRDKADRAASTTSPDPGSMKPSTSTSPTVEARTVKMVAETCTPQ